MNFTIKQKLYLADFNVTLKDLSKYFSNLTKLEKQIITYYFGIDGLDKDEDEIASILKLSEEQVSEILLLTINKLNNIIPKYTLEDKASFELEKFQEMIKQTNNVSITDLNVLEQKLNEYLPFGEVKKQMAKIKKEIKNNNQEIIDDKYDRLKEYNLIINYKKTHDLKFRNELIKMHVNFIYFIAKKYKNRAKTFSLEDLFQEGVIGLIKAIEKFKPELNYRLITYASFWINQSIQRALNQKDHMIRLSTQNEQKKYQYYYLVENYQKNLKRNPTLKEICDELQVDEYVANCYLNGYLDPDSLNRKINTEEDEGREFGEFIVNDNYNVEKEVIDNTLLKADIQKALNTLSDREKLVVTLRYGLNGQIWTLEQIGNRLGITRERARQIEIKALQKLKTPLRSTGLKAYLTENDDNEIKTIDISEYYHFDLPYIKLALHYMTDNVKRKTYEIWGNYLERKIPANITITILNPLEEFLQKYRKIYYNFSIEGVIITLHYPNILKLYNNHKLDNIYLLFSKYNQNYLNYCLQLDNTLNLYLNKDNTFNLNNIFKKENIKDFVISINNFEELLQNQLDHYNNLKFNKKFISLKDFYADYNYDYVLLMINKTNIEQRKYFQDKFGNNYLNEIDFNDLTNDEKIILINNIDNFKRFLDKYYLDYKNNNLINLNPKNDLTLNNIDIYEYINQKIGRKDVSKQLIDFILDYLPPYYIKAFQDAWQSDHFRNVKTLKNKKSNTFYQAMSEVKCDLLKIYNLAQNDYSLSNLKSEYVKLHKKRFKNLILEELAIYFKEYEKDYVLFILNLCQEDLRQYLIDLFQRTIFKKELFNNQDFKLQEFAKKLSNNYLIWKSNPQFLTKDLIQSEEKSSLKLIK